jgi:hypothetical protein
MGLHFVPYTSLRVQNFLGFEVLTNMMHTLIFKGERKWKKKNSFAHHLYKCYNLLNAAKNI